MSGSDQTKHTLKFFHPQPTVRAGMKRAKDAPTRPKNAFQLFAASQRPLLPKSMAFADQGKMLGEMWKELDRATQDRFLEEAFADKTRFDAEEAEYNKLQTIDVAAVADVPDHTSDHKGRRVDVDTKQTTGITSSTVVPNGNAAIEMDAKSLHQKLYIQCRDKLLHIQRMVHEAQADVRQKQESLALRPTSKEAIDALHASLLSRLEKRQMLIDARAEFREQSLRFRQARKPPVTPMPPCIHARKPRVTPAYQFFRQEQRLLLREQNETLTFSEIASTISDRWAKLSDEGRRPYQKMHEDEAEQMAGEIARYEAANGQQTIAQKPKPVTKPATSVSTATSTDHKRTFKSPAVHSSTACETSSGDDDIVDRSHTVSFDDDPCSRHWLL